MTYNVRHDKEEDIWQKEFDESTKVYVSPIDTNTFLCDNCEVQLTSNRYHCEICKDFDLCEKCKFTTTSDHATSHKMKLVGGEFSVNFTCDVCDKPIRGQRYHCFVCQDFDLCSNCKNTQTGNHSSGHQMLCLSI